jgi:hypothetical protein
MLTMPAMPGEKADMMASAGRNPLFITCRPNGVERR